MGLLDKFKKTKNAKWVVNNKPTNIELHESYISFESAAKQITVFYKDIQDIKLEMYVIKIKTVVESYKIVPRHIKGAKDISNELYNQILKSIGECK